MYAYVNCQSTSYIMIELLHCSFNQFQSRLWYAYYMEIKVFTCGSTKKPALQSCGHSGKRKLWANEQIVATIFKCKMSANEAADLHGVPCSM